MIKTCSLNFVNNEYFDTDIMTKDGRVLFSANDKVTPEVILRLYFKEIYIKEKQAEVKPKEIVQEPIEEEKPEIKVGVGASVSAGISAAEKELGIKQTIDIYDEDEEQSAKDLALKMPRMTIGSAPLQEAKEEPEDTQLKFSEERAKKVAKYSVDLGRILNVPESELKILEQAAYYHNIGIDRFKQSDMSKKGFRKKLAEVSYNILLNEMGMQPVIAETAKFCVINYEPKDFSLHEKIPFHHIVAVTSYYEAMFMKTNSKEKALAKMLQLGGNKFNTFVLHKFITIMKDTNE